VYLPTYRSDGRFGVGQRPTTRAHDPRLDDYQATALLLTNRPAPAPRDPEAQRGQQVAAAHQGAAMSPQPGMFGIAAGPSVFVLDPRGEVDPLMSRLPPAVGARRQWTMERRAPDGYLNDVVADRSILNDAPLAALDNELRQLSRAPLETPGRLTLFRKLSADTGRLIAQSSYGPERLTLDDLSHEAPRSLREGGLEIAVPRGQAANRVEAELSGNYDYEFDWIDGDRTVAQTHSRGSLMAPPALAIRTVAPSPTPSVTALRLRCGRGIGPCLVGAVRLVH